MRRSVWWAWLAILAGFALIPLTRGREWLGWVVLPLLCGGEGVLTFWWCRDAWRALLRRLREEEG